MSEFDEAVKKAEESDGNNIARLEKRIEGLEDGLRERNFFWLAVLFLVVDVLTFHNMATWGAPIAILALQIIILVVVARRCGVEEVWQLVDKVVNSDRFNENKPQK